MDQHCNKRDNDEKCEELIKALVKIEDYKLNTESLGEELSDALTKIDSYKSITENLAVQIESFGEIVNKLNDTVVAIHESLVGDLSSKGWLTRIEATEAKQAIIEKDLSTIKDTMQLMVPWFTAFKWLIAVVAPIVALGVVTVFWGLLTGKIKIV